MIPKLSIVTGTMNRQESFLRLLNSIVEHTSVSWELVVSDASDEPYNLQLPENVKVLPERPRLGCVQGYNRAFRAATGEWVIWLNDDCEVLPDYAGAAIRFMEANRQIGLGAIHYSEDGGPFHINSAWGCIYANFGIFQRSLGSGLGYFDEDLQMYGCDNSLTLRVLLAGYGVAGIADSRVIHHSVKDDHRTMNQSSRRSDNDSRPPNAIRTGPLSMMVPSRGVMAGVRKQQSIDETPYRVRIRLPAGLDQCGSPWVQNVSCRRTARSGGSADHGGIQLLRSPCR